MASSSKMQCDVKEEDKEEEFERFDDFTLASSWERFISEIEAVCRQWLADGSKNLLQKGAVCLSSSKSLYRVKFELKYATKSYYMEYYFEINNDGKVADWSCNLHDLQLSFGVTEFLVIAPQSASGVVLDAPEASKLLSAIAIALSNCSSLWPAFVPVHDPSRKAYIGIQNMGTIFTRRFEADRIGSQVPLKLMHLEGLYELFLSKFVFSPLDFSTHLFKVHFGMKLTYKTLPYDDDDDDIRGADIELSESGENPGGDIRNKTQWDCDCPWSEWYSAEDPVKGFNLIAIWLEKTVESSLEMAELENASPHEAEKWFILPNFNPNFTHGSFGNTIGFASQLHLLVNALDISFEAQFMEDFVSVENSGSDNLKSSTVIPPPTVLDRVLKDLFHGGVQLPHLTESEHKSSRAIKGAPLESLFAQFCLHSLWFGNCNIRAIAALWIEFVREVRWCWEESQPLPRMPASGIIDLSSCLVNQKLHMISFYVRLSAEAYQPNSLAGPCLAGDAALWYIKNQPSCLLCSSSISDASCHPETSISMSSSEAQDAATSADLRPSDCIRRGSAGVVDMMLLKSYQNMNVPFTQDAPLMTEDMHEERLRAVEALGDSISFSAQLERDILSSDMSAFKAANPDAVFEDFIRWHSPRDWEDDFFEASGEVWTNDTTEQSNKDWPPRGELSERMAERGNSWRKIWNDAPALPASEQKPLSDPNREGEKVLHYLETLRPHLLLEQMVCTAFRASADTINRTNFGGLKQMATKMGQIYLTIASTLKPLQANHLSVNSEIIENLKRLCVVFGHVEKLLTVAASLHRKFLQALRLSEVIFSVYYNFYQPKMGIGLVGDMEFDKKHQVRMHEREVVANMFKPPTSNQSWRKVLSMGNLLNGHEPVLREIIFSLRDSVRGSYYAASTPRAYKKEIETHRMYICGTSNDLRVALSVASCD
ncbi:LOW QUALITY PROTEIN: uncharacterized protein LOC130770977 [Actinidia eriantha]|uniref:LOW QUALITY PROTEIN: uncharacterized protein LOC130770977 n=1 Tax=Actinidia eriantha TaxID=165200 RepID=UPI0025903919|nr:LOW QUALITY PROTEIN: uncharacterized protein LOC130770977 [Actinidia eriantha]